MKYPKMRHLKKFNELHSSTYGRAADKLSDINPYEYEDNILNLRYHSDIMSIINNESGKTPDNIISIFKDILKMESMWKRLHKESDEAYNEYIKKNLRKVDRSKRDSVRTEASKLSKEILKPYFEFKRKLQKDTMDVYDIKIGDSFKYDNNDFILTKVTDHEYFLDGPLTYYHERIDIKEFPLELESGNLVKTDLKTIYNEDSKKWEFYKEEEVPYNNELIEDIKEWFNDNGGDFTLHDEDDDELSYSSREYGNVGSETPGQEDIRNAIKIKRELSKIYKDINITIDEIDEWVHIDISV